MQLGRFFQNTIQRLTRQPIATASLQFRLTLELLAISTAAVGGLAVWAGWQMEQNLVAAHKQTLEYIATRFPEEVALYGEVESLERGLEETIDRVSTPMLMAWVKTPEGKLLAQSAGMSEQALEIRYAERLESVPQSPTVFHWRDRYIVLCGNPLVVRGQPLGQVYFSQDITEDRRKLDASLGRLLLASGVTLVVLTVAISRRIYRAIQPLAEMSQVARAISADDLGDRVQSVQLELQQAPEEILGLARAFNAMLSRLSAAWERQREFVGNVSHELRTPLTIVGGYLQSLLRRGENLNDYQRQALATALAETERTISMLAALLDLARADNGHLYLALHPTVLNTLVAEVAAMSEQTSNRKIRVVAKEEDIVTRADRDRLQQVLINLVQNAIEYSAAAEPVEIILEKTDRRALICVRDFGVGIALAEQTRIFERFYRVDRARSRKGTGLGLAIAKSLTEGMEGQISLRSKPGEGSAFTISLPLWQS